MPEVGATADDAGAVVVVRFSVVVVCRGVGATTDDARTVVHERCGVVVVGRRFGAAGARCCCLLHERHTQGPAWQACSVVFGGVDVKVAGTVVRATQHFQFVAHAVAVAVVDATVACVEFFRGTRSPHRLPRWRQSCKHWGCCNPRQPQGTSKSCRRRRTIPGWRRVPLDVDDWALVAPEVVTWPRRTRRPLTGLPCPFAPGTTKMDPPM